MTVHRRYVRKAPARHRPHRGHRTGRYERYRRAACFFRAVLFASLGGWAFLAACCFVASVPVFYVAGVAGLYLGAAPGAIGFVLWWALVVAGIVCVGEAGR